MCIRDRIRRGYDLTSLSRKFYPDADFSDFDMIIGMDDQNIRDLQRMATSEEERNKIHKMTDFCQRFSYRDSAVSYTHLDVYKRQVMFIYFTRRVGKCFI